MKFNIASTLKTVAQRLNPDLEIPNAPPPPPLSTNPPPPTTTGRKTSSPPIPQSSFSASSSPSPKKPRKSRSTSWTKTRNRASSNVSSVFRRSSASIALPVFMGKMPAPPVKVEEETAKETAGAAGADGVAVSVCRDFAVGEAKAKDNEDMPMDTPQRPSTPLDPAMHTLEEGMVPHAYTTVFTSSSPPSAAWETHGIGGAGATRTMLESVLEPAFEEANVESTTLISQSCSSSVYSMPPPAIEATLAISTAGVPTQEVNQASRTQDSDSEINNVKPTTLEPETTTSEHETLKEISSISPPPPTAAAAETVTATSTCLCKAIHLSFPLPSPNETSLAPTAGYTVEKAHLHHISGKDGLTVYTHTPTLISTPTATTTTRFFCKTCGVLMYTIPTIPTNDNDDAGVYLVYSHPADTNASGIVEESKAGGEHDGVEGL